MIMNGMRLMVGAEEEDREGIITMRNQINQEETRTEGSINEWKIEMRIHI